VSSPVVSAKPSVGESALSGSSPHVRTTRLFQLIDQKYIVYLL